MTAMDPREDDDQLEALDTEERGLADRLRDQRPRPSSAFGDQLRRRLLFGARGRETTTAANPQEAFYDEDSDYFAGSPHLRHRSLNRALLEMIIRAADASAGAGLPADLLEVGGGDGSITEPLLAHGLAVTSTEMSAASVERMRARFRHNDRFRAVHDVDGTLTVLDRDRFDCILFASVLHHIPDYKTAIADALARHLRENGSLVTIQDPLYYPRLSAPTRRASSVAYLSWRLTQGNFARGVKTRVRRALRGPSEYDPGDAVEYHVVRDGVDEQALVDSLTPLFDQVQVHRYWSSQGPMQQRLGEALGLRNTFAIVARGYRGSERPNSRSA
jgi:SAM-dependent methyltransferase